ncbi:hypothetical protein B0H14DRAFT_3154453 [Mycena olivaceomarginata]|nr:hypothetical protein B0H14DRAFT_3154453 [Mycena olivaceomarginata]
MRFDVEKSSAIRCMSAMQTVGEREEVCVVCGGIGWNGRGALPRRGRSAGKRVGVKRNAAQAEPVRKGNHGYDERDPKQPSVSEKRKRAEECGARKTRRYGRGRAGRKLAGFDVECTEEEA